jgi:hypothetical protein
MYRGSVTLARVSVVLFVGLVVCADVLAVVGELRAFINSDAAWTLELARRLLHGERLYTRSFEINPPLIVWLHLPFVWLSDMLGVSATLLLRLALYAATLASVGWTASLVRRTVPTITRKQLAALTFIIGSVDLLLPMGAFSEREQLITLLLQPFAALAAARLAGTAIPSAEAVALGIGSGLAIALKPYYAGVWLLLLSLRGGRGRPWITVEDWAILATGAAYALLVLTLTPEFLPLARTLGPAYATFTARSRASILFLSPETYWWLVAVVAWWIRRPRPKDPIGLVLVAASAGAVAAVLLQGKGWLYQFLPLSILSLLLAAHVATLPESEPRRPGERLTRYLALAIMFLITAPLVSRTLAINASRAAGKTERREEMLDLLALVQRHRGAESIAVVSSDMSPVFPLVTVAGLREHISFPCQWLPMAVYRSTLSPGKPVQINAPRSMSPAERLAFDATVGDILRRPDLLLVESRERNELRSGYPRGFDHLQYLAQDPAAAAALRDYRRVGSARGYDLFARR